MNQFLALKAKIPFSYIYLFFLIVVAFGLSMGNIFMSIGSIGLACSWLAEMNFKEKWDKAKQLHFAPFVAIFLFLVPVIWLFNTEDMDFAVRDLVIKLPLLSLPIVLGTMPKLSTPHWWLVITAFLVGLVVATTVGYIRYVTASANNLDFDGRNMAVFISHIRLSLLLGIALFVLLYLFFKNKTRLRFLFILPLVYFIFFIRLMESGTGYVVMLFIATIALFFVLKKLANRRTKILLLIGFLTAIAGITSYIFILYKHQTEVRDPANLSQLETHTAYGNVYEHDINRKWLENGNYVWIYISFPEAEKAWNERSKLPFAGKDHKGQPIFGTLFRFLTSKGLRKDYNGVYSLSDNEISQIENGVTSYLPPKTGFTARIENILFEIVNHQLNHNPNGHSIIQRMLYTQAGWELFKANWLLGVGTGDAPHSFDNYYSAINSPLYPNNRLRAHNQMLTFLICFGVVGFVILMFSIVYPIVKVKPATKFFWVFIGIATISFFVDDTLDTQAGVTFYVFFYSFFLFQNNYKFEETQGNK